ncbi:nucleotidyltransferase family protein [Paenibacillus sp. MMS18-CY102]|uniref:nucleotidyltransferase family protein n=1 Tax=Paenibacillus sp. MMS18-CY102 TaxID=2682849 RepID=UPI001922393C|nr:nucleotidyltransferase family protein [Paenibacillus sp. MMS18-CY102]
MEDLQQVRDLKLPDCYIAAGYIRNMVWDRLHGFDARGMHGDIDVVFFDPTDISEDRDHALEQELIARTENDKWSVKNQARMHIQNGDSPYKDTVDAITYWTETVTAVGARLNQADEIEIIAPYGLEDIFEMVVRRAPKFEDKDYYMRRVRNKRWKEQWSGLRVIEE